MKSEEARTAEAITSLEARLESWGLDDAKAKATEYVRDMLRAGWRPRAREVWTPPALNSGHTASTETAAQAAAAIRASIAEATADHCSHGVRRTHCTAHAATPAPEDLADRTQEDA